MAAPKKVNTTKSIKKEELNDKKIDNIAKKTGEVLAKQGKLRVSIPKIEGSGETHIECAINGYNYIIKRGVGVEIPVEVYDVLKNAQIL